MYSVSQGPGDRKARRGGRCRARHNIDDARQPGIGDRCQSRYLREFAALVGRHRNPSGESNASRDCQLLGQDGYDKADEGANMVVLWGWTADGERAMEGGRASATQDIIVVGEKHVQQCSPIRVVRKSVLSQIGVDIERPRRWTRPGLMSLVLLLSVCMFQSVDVNKVVCCKFDVLNKTLQCCLPFSTRICRDGL